MKLWVWWLRNGSWRNGDFAAMMKGAILGVGNVALNGHLPGWIERGDVDIVAAADARPDRLEALGQTLPNAKRYDSAEELLARETLDFVDVCTPPATHAAPGT